MSRLVLLATASLLLGAAQANASTMFAQDNLVTDSQAALAAAGFAPAHFVDPHLINPWGMSRNPTGPFWVSNQGDATATLYRGTGAIQALVVSIPQNPSPPAGPTGQAFDGSGAFRLTSGGKTGAALFLFANLDGSISAWNPTGTVTQAVQVVPPSAASGRTAVYTGLATGAVGSAHFIYAADSRNGRIDVFDTSYAAASLPGGFVDPTVPAGLKPFNVQNIDGKLYVTYASADGDNAPLGSGAVSVFATDGTLLQSLTSGGPLASPWGLALAPAGFGTFGGDLLVGNFNDENGNINAFDPVTGAFEGTLSLLNGMPISLPDLWSLGFGNGGAAGRANQLFFTAGIGDEAHGLFGVLNPMPEPASLLLLGLGGAMLGLVRRRG